MTRRYVKNLDCVWVITAPVNRLINLTFTAFVLEAASAGGCRFDHVKVRQLHVVPRTLWGDTSMCCPQAQAELRDCSHTDTQLLGAINTVLLGEVSAPDDSLPLWAPV